MTDIQTLINSEVRAERMMAYRRMRAWSATHMGIRYKMGHGGWYPNDDSPTRTGRCDCSGFISWLLPMSRHLGASRKGEIFGFNWIETTMVYNDATGPGRLFRRLPGIVDGCFLVYPDRGRKQGHIAYVADADSLMGYDCSSRGWRNAIRYRNLGFMVRRGAIPIALAQEANELQYRVS